MKNEVTRNSKTIEAGDVLYYTDNSNSQRWVVTELLEGGFSAKDDFEERDFMFAELQNGWSISEKTKAHKEQYRTAKYV